MAEVDKRLLNMDGATATAEDAAKKLLFPRMMLEIKQAHHVGNTIRMWKLPLILLDSLSYGGAIAQFYWLTKVLESCLDAHKDAPILARVRGLGHRIAPLYEADLAELFGGAWAEAARSARTPATDAYCRVLESSTPTQLVAASFIIYGALVIGGGKATQRKVAKVFRGCRHALYDVADDMLTARTAFRECYNATGAENPEAFDELVAEAGKFMARNNEVVVSVRVTPFWWWRVAVVAAAATVAAAACAATPYGADNKFVSRSAGLAMGASLSVGMWGLQQQQQQQQQQRAQKAQ